MIDPQNAVVKLCAQGMQLTQDGDGESAKRLFLEAWQQSNTPFERAIAAHYVAKHQLTSEEIKDWNQKALDNANAVEGDDAKELYPSLYLNLGRSHEDSGSLEEARHCYEQALRLSIHLPDNGYRHLIENSATAGVKRVATIPRSLLGER